ncbi:MAG: LamG domain-containing protein [Chloroflexi bacterium]|nr:LamG domain-containing protein [Chloroflexota bacterium]
MDYVFDPNLVLYLPFYKLDGASFMSGDAYGHLATVTGALWTPVGHLFDGIDDKITVPHHASFNPSTSGLSVLAWAKCTDVALSDRRLVTKQKVSASFDGFVLNVTQTNGYANLYVRDDLTNTLDTVYNGASYADSSFHLFAGTILLGSATGAKVYVDGNLKKTGDLSSLTGSITTTADLFIGKFRDASGYFAGTIGEVWLYSRVLSAVEIQDIYLATKGRYQ